MKILETNLLYSAGSAGRTFLRMLSRTFEHNGQSREYFMVARGDGKLPSHEQKRPDAVIIHGIQKGDPNRLLLTSEFRIPLGCRELGFPAGLIEEKDYAGESDIEAAAKRAAIRECFEETGMHFEPKTCSPPNLYSSAGMSNESAIIVFGEVKGEPCRDHCEGDEDIDIVLATPEMCLALSEDKSIAHSKGAYPFLLFFAQAVLIDAYLAGGNHGNLEHDHP